MVRRLGGHMELAYLHGLLITGGRVGCYVREGADVGAAEDDNAVANNLINPPEFEANR